MRPEAGAHLWDAVEAAKLVRDFSDGKSEEEFNDDPLLRSAIERQLEVLGEALNRLRRDDAATAARIRDLGRVVGMRNAIAHEYGELDYEIVWRAVTTGVPALIAVLEPLVVEALRDLEPEP